MGNRFSSKKNIKNEEPAVAETTWTKSEVESVEVVTPDRQPPPPLLIQELALLRRTFNGSSIDCPVAIEILRNLGVRGIFFRCGKVMAWEVKPEEPVYNLIHDYIANSHSIRVGVKILSILHLTPRVTSSQDEHVSLRFGVNPKTKNKYRMMLFHGTTKRDLISILETGLELPVEIKGNFGSGIYFTDRISRSYGLTYGRGSGGATSYLLLCDVLLGNMYKTNRTHPDLTAAPEKLGWRKAFQEKTATGRHDSVKGLGKNMPDSMDQKTIDGCVWPVGNTVTSIWSTPLKYNEYVVYSKEQVQIKYLLKVKCVKKSSYK